MKEPHALVFRVKKAHLSFITTDALVVGLCQDNLKPDRLRLVAHQYDENPELMTNLNSNSFGVDIKEPVSSVQDRSGKGVRLRPGIGQANALAGIHSNRPDNALYLQSLTAKLS